MHTTLHHKMQYATQYHTCSRKSKRPFSVWKQSDIIRLQIWFYKLIFHLVVQYVGCLLFFPSVLPNTIVIIVRNSNFFLHSCSYHQYYNFAYISSNWFLHTHMIFAKFAWPIYCSEIAKHFCKPACQHQHKV